MLTKNLLKITHRNIRIRTSNGAIVTYYHEKNYDDVIRVTIPADEL